MDKKGTKFRRNCIKCKVDIHDSQQSYQMRDQAMENDVFFVHRSCFECMNCTLPLTKNNFRIPAKSNLLLCSDDYQELVRKSPNCKKCNKKCAADKVKVDGDFYHSKCAPVVPETQDLQSLEPIHLDRADDKQDIFPSLDLFAQINLKADPQPVEPTPAVQNKTEPSPSNCNLQPKKQEPSCLNGNYYLPPPPYLPNPIYMMQTQPHQQPVMYQSRQPPYYSYPFLVPPQNNSGQNTDSISHTSSNNNNNEIETKSSKVDVKKEAETDSIAAENVKDVHEKNPDQITMKRKSAVRKPTKTGKYRALITEEHKVVLEATWNVTKFPDKDERIRLVIHISATYNQPYFS